MNAGTGAGTGVAWHKVAVGALALVAAAALFAVVTDEPAPDAKPAPDEPSALLAEPPAWGRAGDLSAAPGSTGVRDGLALVSFQGLSLVDLDTGDARWTVPPGGRLAGSTELYSSGGTLLRSGVLVRTRTGVALLSRDDGTVVWHVPVRAGAGERYVPVAADDRTALVTVGPTRGGAARVIAIDVASGRQRWSRDGLVLSAMADGVVVGTVVGTTPGGAVAAWDLDTGRTAWTHSDSDSARVTLTAGDAVLVEGRGAAPARQVVSATSGELLAKLAGHPGTGTCATDGRTLIACPLVRAGGRSAFELYDVPARRVSALSGDFDVRSVCLVTANLIVGANDEGYLVVDREGRVRSSHLPDRPLAVDGKYLVTRSGPAGPPTISAYRLNK
jgi:outer membrane protein assembly factor BamB